MNTLAIASTAAGNACILNDRVGATSDGSSRFTVTACCTHLAVAMKYVKTMQCAPTQIMVDAMPASGCHCVTGDPPKRYPIAAVSRRHSRLKPVMTRKRAGIARGSLGRVEPELRELQVDRRRDLDVLIVAGHEPDVVAGEFHQLRIVGDLIERDRAPLERVEQRGAAHDLWRLHRA